VQGPPAATAGLRAQIQRPPQRVCPASSAPLSRSSTLGAWRLRPTNHRRRGRAAADANCMWHAISRSLVSGRVGCWPCRRRRGQVEEAVKAASLLAPSFVLSRLCSEIRCVSVVTQKSRLDSVIVANHMSRVRVWESWTCLAEAVMQCLDLALCPNGFGCSCQVHYELLSFSSRTRRLEGLLLPSCCPPDISSSSLPSSLNLDDPSSVLPLRQRHHAAAPCEPRRHNLTLHHYPRLGPSREAARQNSSRRNPEGGQMPGPSEPLDLQLHRRLRLRLGCPLSRKVFMAAASDSAL